MKLKIGYRWKDINGKYFSIKNITQNEITYESKETKNLYVADRKHFEKYIQRVYKFWSDKNKSYKNKKKDLT